MISEKKYKEYTKEAVEAHEKHNAYDLCYACGHEVLSTHETYSIVRRRGSEDLDYGHEITFHVKCFLEIAGDDYMMEKF